MRLYLTLIFIFLGACTSLPSAIEEAQVEDVSYNQVSADLDHYGRPQINKPSAGHFVIKSTEFLDAQVYATDSEIGRTLSNQSIEVPQITSTAIHLWPINYRGEYYGNCRSCYFRQLFW